MSEDSSKGTKRLPSDPPSLISPSGSYVDSPDDDDFSTDDSGSFSSGSSESGSEFESDSSDEDMPDLYVRRHRESESQAQAVAESRRAASRQRAKADSRRLRRARKKARNGKRRRTDERTVEVADGVVPSGVAAALSRLDLIGLLGLAEGESQPEPEESVSESESECECHSSVCLLSSFDSSESSSPIVWDFDSGKMKSKLCLIVRCSSSHTHRLHARCCLAFFLANLLQKWKESETEGESEKSDETCFPCPVEACPGLIVDVRNDLTGECIVLGGTARVVAESEGSLKGRSRRRVKHKSQTRTLGAGPSTQSKLSVLADHRERQKQKRSNLRDMERLERVRQDGMDEGSPSWQRNLKKISKTRQRQERKERRRRAREDRRSTCEESVDLLNEEGEEEGSEGEEEEGEIRVTFLSLGGDVALQRMKKRLEGLRLSRLRAELLRHNIPIFVVEESESDGFENVASSSPMTMADEEGAPKSDPVPLFAEEDPHSVGYVISLREKHGILRTLAGEVLNFPLYSVAVPTLGSGNIASVVRFWLKPGDKVAFQLDGDCARNVALIERPSEEQRRRKVRTRLIQTFVADQNSRFEGIACEIERQEEEDADLLYVAVGGEKVVQALIPKSPVDLFHVGDVVVFGLIPEKAEYLRASNVSIKLLKAIS